MAKVELKHLDAFDNRGFIKCESTSTKDFVVQDVPVKKENYLRLLGYDVHSGNDFIIDLDISTAIKFAKTLRTEINKAKGEDQNG